MNEVRLTGLLKERYKTHFAGLQQKLNKPGLCRPCSYSNNLAAHPSSEKMTRPLRLKIHDALNSSLLMDAEGMGIFIGGRRRNRKKKNKKNGQSKKKTKKNDNKSKPVFNESSGSSSDSCSSGRSSPKSEEKIPLLSYCLDENENFDPSDPYCYFCDDEEAENTEMSFLFKKKAKEVKTEKAVVNEMQTRAEESKPEVKAEPPAPAQAVQKEEKPALEESTEKAVDGGAVTETKPAESEEKAPVVDGEAKPSEKEEKSEKSPLVSNKDMGPGGCLCCTIL